MNNAVFFKGIATLILGIVFVYRSKTKKTYYIKSNISYSIVLLGLVFTILSFVFKDKNTLNLLNTVQSILFIIILGYIYMICYSQNNSFEGQKKDIFLELKNNNKMFIVVIIIISFIVIYILDLILKMYVTNVFLK